MKKSLLSLLVAGLCLGVSAPGANAAIISLGLAGLGGPGLLPTNEPGGAASTGSGDVGGGGLMYDTTAMMLSFDLVWGSVNGFTDLTGPVTLAHIHGPTPSSDPASFGEAVGVHTDIFSTITVNTAMDGHATGLIPFADAAGLLGGHYYFNFHTAANGGGELRGQIVVPEPSRALLALIGLVPVAFRRRR